MPHHSSFKKELMSSLEAGYITVINRTNQPVANSVDNSNCMTSDLSVFNVTIPPLGTFGPILVGTSEQDECAFESSYFDMTIGIRVIESQGDWSCGSSPNNLTWSADNSGDIGKVTVYIG
ncbi:hypothetical protein [Hymenobacter volaticus]|uniref:Uncharacterized protein n=1 Tax=Hymenobacter volaticus TaxID=2932254 RepID=A0ABY4GFD8_9BACT|nr:hypothetical protein [Hymenobacter volaticus]UOQ69548.1 hypothetical protein MUN86_28320 [Hymenobacter volaticus]